MHRLMFIFACLLTATLVAAQAQGPQSARDIQLVGDRFKPLKWDEMNPAQKTMSGNPQSKLKNRLWLSTTLLI